MLKVCSVCYFLFIFLGLVLNCGAVENQKQVDKTRIRVINNSGYGFTNVSLFSMKFEDLQAGDTSEYRELRYDPLKHDPLIYCINNGTNFGRYLKIPEKSISHFSYVIDSLKNEIIYVSTKTDQRRTKNK